MSDIIPLATFRVDDTECVVLTRAQFDQVMAALDDRIDADAARRALDELAGREGDVLSEEELAEMTAAPLRFWRRRRGLTQAQLAAAADVSQSYVAEIESGAQDGSLRVMRRFAEALDVRLDDLAA